MSVEAFEARCTPKSGRTLITGSRVYNGKEDRRKRYPDALGVDMERGEGVDEVRNLENLWFTEPFAHIECMSVLEHCRRPWMMADRLERILEPLGTILVTVPFIWRVHGYPDDYWRMTINGVKSLFTQIDWQHESYSHRGLSDEKDIPSVRSPDDWPCFARTETCLFGVKRG